MLSFVGRDGQTVGNRDGQIEIDCVGGFVVGSTCPPATSARTSRLSGASVSRIRLSFFELIFFMTVSPCPDEEHASGQAQPRDFVRARRGIASTAIDDSQPGRYDAST